MSSADIMQVFGTVRLTRDAELKYTSSGLAVCSFGVAWNKKVKKGDTWENIGQFIDCVLFGELGKALNEYLKKGKQITIISDLDYQSWEDREGKIRHKHVLKINNIVLLGGNANTKQENKNDAHGEGVNNTANRIEDDFEDDIPF